MGRKGFVWTNSEAFTGMVVNPSGQQFAAKRLEKINNIEMQKKNNKNIILLKKKKS